MRVLIATARMGACPAHEAGQAFARGWQSERPADQLAVIPMGAGGTAFTEAAATLVSEPQVLICPAAALVAADQRAAHELRRRIADASQVVIDLAEHTTPDLGVGILHGLGAEVSRDDEGGLRSIDLGPVQDLFAHLERVDVIIPAQDRDFRVLGLKGMTSQRSAREREAAPQEAGTEWDPAALMAVEQRVEADAAVLRQAAGHDLADAPGLGAAGGAPFAFSLLGAAVHTGPEWIAAHTGLADSLAVADLVVAGTTEYDFARRGGEEVEAVAALAQEAMVPVVAIAGAVMISPRELRTHGVEDAYAVFSGADGVAGKPQAQWADRLTPQAVESLGRTVARTWSRR